MYRQLADVGLDPFTPARLERLERHEEVTDRLVAGLTVFNRELSSRRTVLVNLTRTLTQLSTEYAKLDRHEEAVTAAEEAVTVSRELAGNYPPLVDLLVQSLDTLADRYNAAGQGGRGDAAWAQVMNKWRMYPAAYPSLLVARARAGTDAAVVAAYLVEALQVIGDSTRAFRDVVLPARELARRWHAERPDEFDRHWQHLFGEMPAWLEIDQSVIHRVTDWVRGTASREEAVSYLEEHRAQLLRPDAEIMLDELALVIAPAIIDKYRSLLTEARERAD